MIRRDDDDHWLLISQVDHAQVAAEIAAAWGNERIAGLPLPELLVTAIRHHDDGWREWARSPRVDPETGQPRNFTEMPMREATVLWSQSIAVCSGEADTPQKSDETPGRLSPLAGLWVSRHFCWLAAKAIESRQDDIEDCRALQRFLDTQSELQTVLRRQAARDFESRGLELDGLIENGFRCLQFFDGLSLWLCCAQRSEPLDFEIPGGQTARVAEGGCGSGFRNQGNTERRSPPASQAALQAVRLEPQTPSRIVVTPYPLSVAHLELAVEARRIPARRYADDNDLHAALRDAPTVRLNWLLSPSG